jgi:HlyD family secretion protein
MKKVFRIILTIIFISMFIGTIVFLYIKSQKKPDMFETKTAIKTNIVKKTVATGSVVPRREIEIKPQISGIIEKIYVEAGQHIQKGDMIAKVKIIPNMINLNNAQAQLEKAKINYKDVKMVYDRQKKLYEDKVIPLAEFEKNQLQLEDANASLKSSEDNLELIKEGVTKGSGKETNTIIRSTIEGMVLDVPVKEGNSVIESNTFNAGTTIAFVADMGEMIFKGKVDETEVGKIIVGMKLTLTIGAIEKQNFDAFLEYISPKGVEENGAIQFEIKAKVVPKKSTFIRAGYSANADIVLERRDSVMAIEESLIKTGKDSTYVEVETKPNTFEKRLIETGLSDGINVEVLKGLKKEEKIKAGKKL